MDVDAGPPDVGRPEKDANVAVTDLLVEDLPLQVALRLLHVGDLRPLHAALDQGIAQRVVEVEVAQVRNGLRVGLFLFRLGRLVLAGLDALQERQRLQVLLLRHAQVREHHRGATRGRRLRLLGRALVERRNQVCRLVDARLGIVLNALESAHQPQVERRGCRVVDDVGDVFVLLVLLAGERVKLLLPVHPALTVLVRRVLPVVLHPPVDPRLDRLIPYRVLRRRQRLHLAALQLRELQVRHGARRNVVRHLREQGVERLQVLVAVDRLEPAGRTVRPRVVYLLRVEELRVEAVEVGQAERPQHRRGEIPQHRVELGRAVHHRRSRAEHHVPFVRHAVDRRNLRVGVERALRLRGVDALHLRPAPGEFGPEIQVLVGVRFVYQHGVDAHLVPCDAAVLLLGGLLHLFLDAVDLPLQVFDLLFVGAVEGCVCIGFELREQFHLLRHARPDVPEAVVRDHDEVVVAVGGLGERLLARRLVLQCFSVQEQRISAREDAPGFLQESRHRLVMDDEHRLVGAAGALPQQRDRQQDHRLAAAGVEGDETVAAHNPAVDAVLLRRPQLAWDELSVLLDLQIEAGAPDHRHDRRRVELARREAVELRVEGVPQRLEPRSVARQPVFPVPVQVRHRLREGERPLLVGDGPLRVPFLDRVGELGRLEVQLRLEDLHEVVRAGDPLDRERVRPGGRRDRVVVLDVRESPRATLPGVVVRGLDPGLHVELRVDEVGVVLRIDPRLSDGQRYRLDRQIDGLDLLQLLDVRLEAVVVLGKLLGDLQLRHDVAAQVVVARLVGAVRLDEDGPRLAQRRLQLRDALVGDLRHVAPVDFGERGDRRNEGVPRVRNLRR